MNYLLRPRICPSSLASSGVGPYGVPFRYGNQSRGSAGRLPGGTPIFLALAALRSVPQAGSQFRGLAIAIHEISGLDEMAKTCILAEKSMQKLSQSEVYSTSKTWSLGQVRVQWLCRWKRCGVRRRAQGIRRE
jgi:hypothetical protein